MKSFEPPTFASDSTCPRPWANQLLIFLIEGERYFLDYRGLSFHFLFELRDEAGASGVGAGEEAAPPVRIGPEQFAGFCVEDG